MENINLAAFVPLILILWFLGSWLHGVILARNESFTRGIVAFFIAPYGLILSIMWQLGFIKRKVLRADT